MNPYVTSPGHINASREMWGLAKSRDIRLTTEAMALTAQSPIKINLPRFAPSWAA